MKRSIKITLIAFAVVLVIVAGGLLWKTREEAHNLLHAPMTVRNLPGETPADDNLPFEDVSITNPDGMELYGWFIPSENGAVIIMQHGYKSTRDELLNEAEMMHRHGYGVLLTTVRAHDVSAGELITLGYYEMMDMEAWYQYLISRDDVDPDKIGIIGNSYGGMLAIQYSEQNAKNKAIDANCSFS